jgi:hypothetical protein
VITHQLLGALQACLAVPFHSAKIFENHYKRRLIRV